MGNLSRRKGRAGEQELARLLRDHLGDGNRNAHYNEIVEAARNWFDEVIFERYPTWEEVEKTSVQNCGLDGLPSYETLLKAFGGNEKNVASHWSLCVKQGIGAEVLTRFTPPSRKAKSATRSLISTPLLGG